jgi:hypothetical protein
MTKAEQTRLVRLRSKLMQMAASSSRGVSHACRHFGISRKSFYKWKKRYDEHGDTGLCDQSRTPRNSPESDTARSREQDSVPPAELPLWPPEDCRLPEAVPSCFRRWRDGPSDSDQARCESTARESEVPPACEALEALREAAARAPAADGCEVSRAHPGDAEASVSVHRHRRLHADSCPEDLRRMHASQRDSLRRRTGRTPGWMDRRPTNGY